MLEYLRLILMWQSTDNSVKDHFPTAFTRHSFIHTFDKNFHPFLESTIYESLTLSHYPALKYQCSINKCTRGSSRRWELQLHNLFPNLRGICLKGLRHLCNIFIGLVWKITYTFCNKIHGNNLMTRRSRKVSLTILSVSCDCYLITV